MQYADAVAKRMDVDAVEVQVDDMMRNVLQHVYGATKLEAEDAQKELQALEDAVNAAQGNEHDSTVLNLALNSMQRLHFDKIKLEESEESDEEEEEEPAVTADQMEVRVSAACMHACKISPSQHNNILVKEHSCGCMGAVS